MYKCYYVQFRMSLIALSYIITAHSPKEPTFKCVTSHIVGIVSKETCAALVGN